MSGAYGHATRETSIRSSDPMPGGTFVAMEPNAVVAIRPLYGWSLLRKRWGQM